MYNFLIDPNKWEKVGTVQLEQMKPYWFKKTNGQIVMATPYSNGYSSGIAECYSEDGCLRINGSKFHIVKGGMVQPVLN